MRIVIVEDEVQTREGLSRLIERIDPRYRVVGSAANGQKGLELAMEAADPDVSKESCCVCGGQITFEKNSGGNRIVAVKAVIQKEKDE